MYIYLNCGSFPCRKHEIYSMQWAEKVDLSKFIIAAAPFGGPIGMSLDWNHLIDYW